MASFKGRPRSEEGSEWRASSGIESAGAALTRQIKGGGRIEYEAVEEELATASPAVLQDPTGTIARWRAHAALRMHTVNDRRVRGFMRVARTDLFHIGVNWQP